MSNEPWKALVGQVIARRTDKDYAGQRSALRRGLRPNGQMTAIPVVAPFAAGVNLNALVRSAAFIAEHTKIPHRSGVSFGRSMCLLTQRRTGDWPSSDMKKRDGIGRRVSLIGRMDLEAACKEINSLLGFAASEGISLDFYDLTSTLLSWGDGLDDESIAARQSLLVDYYTPIRKA